MTIEVWDRQPLGDQEDVRRPHQGHRCAAVGRHGVHRARLRHARAASGPVIPDDAHVRAGAPRHNDGARMLRRGYNFVDGSNPLGGLDAGLFFIAFVRDPRTHFIPIQNKMAVSDAMMEYLQFTGSALFAVPPGHRPGRVRRSGALQRSPHAGRAGVGPGVKPR